MEKIVIIPALLGDITQKNRRLNRIIKDRDDGNKALL